MMQGIFFTTPGTSAFRNFLFSDNLHQYTLFSSAVELTVENLLPWAEIEFAAGYRHYHFPAHNLPFKMCIPIVLAGSVVLILADRLMWRKLFDAGVFTNPVAPPAVAPTQCRLRTSLMTTHTFEQIDYALDKFARIGRELGVI